jgi:hypothetical protein
VSSELQASRNFFYENSLFFEKYDFFIKKPYMAGKR